jgi:hypothetical protein
MARTIAKFSRQKSNLARRKRLPFRIIRLSAIFSAMSGNTDHICFFNRSPISVDWSLCAWNGASKGPTFNAPPASRLIPDFDQRTGCRAANNFPSDLIEGQDFLSEAGAGD